MKAEELMIGDWVQDSSGAKFKIIYIEYHCTRVEFKGEELIIPCFEQANIKPIPLTPEILVNNGFVYITSQGIYEFCTDDYRILWPTDDKNTLAINSYFAKYGILTKSDIDYVHQLQHALRLCGINKEIKL